MNYGAVAAIMIVLNTEIEQDLQSQIFLDDAITGLFLDDGVTPLYVDGGIS